MAIDQVKKRIKELVSDDANNLLIIRGSWGVGKTHFWNETIGELFDGQKNRNKRKRKYCYVSMFGISDIESVKNQIAGSYFIDMGVSTRRRTVLSWFSQQNVDGVHNLIKSVPYLGVLPVGLATALAFSAVKNAVICFDDIERKSESLNMKDLLGLAASLKELRNCKVVFILNEDQLKTSDKEEFFRYNEKLIDWSFDFSPSFAEAFDLVFSSDDINYNFIRQKAQLLDIRNIRVLKRIRVMIDYFTSRLTSDSAIVSEQILSSLVLFGWVEFDKEAKRPSLDFLKNYSHYVYEYRRSQRPEDEARIEDSFHEKLRLYGYVRTDDFDLVLVDFVKRGFINEELLNLALERIENAEQYQRISDEIRDVWRMYNSRFGDNAVEFATKLKEVYEKHMAIQTVGSIIEPVSILRHLAFNQEADGLIDRFVAECITVEKLVEMRFSKESRAEIGDVYLRNKLDEVFAKRPGVTYTFDEAIKKVALMSNEWEVAGEIQYLRTYDSEEFYNFLKSYSDSDLYLVIRSLQEKSGLKEKVEDALRRIASESAIDKLRVEAYYKIDLDSEKGEEQNS